MHKPFFGEDRENLLKNKKILSDLRISEVLLDLKEDSFDLNYEEMIQYEIFEIEEKGGGRKIRDPEMEKRLYEWYYDHRLVKQLPVTSRMIKNKALELTSLKDFNASKGWLEKIKKKYNLQISRSLSSSKKMKTQ